MALPDIAANEYINGDFSQGLRGFRPNWGGPDNAPPVVQPLNEPEGGLAAIKTGETASFTMYGGPHVIGFSQGAWRVFAGEKIGVTFEARASAFTPSRLKVVAFFMNHSGVVLSQAEVASEYGNGLFKVYGGIFTAPEDGYVALEGYLERQGGPGSMDIHLRRVALTRMPAEAVTPPAYSAPVRDNYNQPTVSALRFGAYGDGSKDDTSAINRGLAWLKNNGGGTLYLPAGVYKVTNSLNIEAGSIHLVGAGFNTRIVGYGSFNTVSIRGSQGSGFYSNAVRDIYFTESAKTGGRTIYAQWVNRLNCENLFVDDSHSGIEIDNYNDILLESLKLFRLQTSGHQMLLLKGGAGGVGRSDVATLRDVVFAGSGTSNGVPPKERGKNGLVLDGFVATVSVHKIYCTTVEGVGVWVRNTVGASEPPSFVNLVAPEADFPTGHAIYLDHATTVDISMPMLNGAYSNSGIFIRDGVQRVGITGGFVSGSGDNGITVEGRHVRINGVDCRNNSQPNYGGTSGRWSGIEIRAQARSVTVTGCMLGSDEHANWQHSGVRVRSGADRFAVVGNVGAGMNLNGVVVNEAGSGATKVAANNV